MKLIQTKNFEIAATEYGDPEAAKLAILLPGRLDSRDYANFISHGNTLAELGYYAVSIDPPGTWDSPGDISLYTTSNYVEAVEELIEALGARKTLLVGHSRGGATAMLASVDPRVEAIAVVNAAYGAPSEPDKRELKNGLLPETRDLPFDDGSGKQKTFMLPMSYFEDGKRHNPIVALKTFTGAKLLAHAVTDEFYTPKEIRQLYDELDEPKQFLELDRDHDYRLYPDAIEQVNEALRKFVAEKVQNNEK